MDHVANRIQGLNQRGGRMLTAVDLLAAGTVDLRLMAYLMRAMRQGASVLACAGPGGTGKTTLLGALLCFLPEDARLQVVEQAEPPSWYDRLSSGHDQVWFLCHELGSGPWYSYLWGEGARSLLEMPLSRPGRFCATTVHADSLDELRHLLQGPGIGIRAEAFARLHLIVFMQAVRTGRLAWLRRVSGAYAVTGRPGASHRHLCHWDSHTDSFVWTEGATKTERPGTNALTPYIEFLRDLERREVVELAAARREVLSFYRGFGLGSGAPRP